MGTSVSVRGLLSRRTGVLNGKDKGKNPRRRRGGPFSSPQLKTLIKCTKGQLQVTKYENGGRQERYPETIL